MAKRLVLEQWERDRLFGEAVIRGFIDGQRITALLQWWSGDRVGVSQGNKEPQVVLQLGTPSPHAFDFLEHKHVKRSNKR